MSLCCAPRGHKRGAQVFTTVIMKLTTLNETLTLFKLRHCESLSVLLKSFWFPLICISLPLSSFAGVPVHRSLWKEGSNRKFSSWLVLTAGPDLNGLQCMREQLQPLNKMCVFPMFHSFTGLINTSAVEPTGLCSCKGSIWCESQRGIFTWRTGALCPSWGCPCVLVVPWWIWLFPAHLANTRVALAEEQTHPSLCVFVLWLPF